MNIIEKLGLKTPNELRTVGDAWKVYELAGMIKPRATTDDFFKQANILKKRIDEKNLLLELLIEDMEWFLDSMDLSGESEDEREWRLSRIAIIEKVTNKSLQAEIKELL